jgi:Tol biopolymer transport system component
MALGAGTRIAQYEIRAPLGSGGMGEVYRARDLTLGRDVALKFLPPHLSADPDRLRRFEQEARAASALNHPAIVAVYELGRTEAQPYISMELVDGQTLRQLLGRGPLAPRRLLPIAAQIASALAKAHAAGIVHRDLKPENLMVSSDDHAKVLDFGVAKLTGDLAGDRSEATTLDRGTQPGALVGTVEYMSPEQASGRAADFRSDQFSFGLVLYELLTGRRPFQRATTVETLSAVIRDDLPPLELSPALVPLGWIVERCLAKAPEDRYASTQDLALDLARIRDRLGDRATSAPAASASAIGRRELVAWAAVVVLGAVGLASLMRGSGGARSEPGAVRFTIAPPAGGDFAFTVGVSPFAVSPDGHRLAFVASVEGQRRPHAWLRSFDSLESRPLAGTEGASGLFWSPDGSTLGFFADGKLKRVPVSGGDVATICDARGGSGATWNRDDVILFTPSVDSPLSRVPAAGDTPVPVTSLDPARQESAHMWPAFLPDGRHYVFVSGGGEKAGVYLGSLDSSERTFLLTATWVAAVEADWLFFVRDRHLMAQRLDVAAKAVVGSPVLVAEEVATTGPTSAVAVSARGDVVYWAGPGTRDITQLTWLRRDGTVVGTVGPPGPYMNVRLSPDGRRAAVDRFDATPAVWLIDVERGTTLRLTFGPLYDSTPIWAPDGRSLVFTSARGTPPNLFVTSLDAQAEPRRVFTSVIQVFPQSWSRDGVIAFVLIDPKSLADIWTVPASGGQDPQPLIHTEFVETDPRISPDGRWLAYVSNESGRSEVVVTRFPRAAGKWPVSVGGGAWPMWRPDGRELYYRAPDGKLMAVTVGAGSDFVAGAPQGLFTPQARPSALGLGTYYDVAADGRFLVNLFVERRSSPATVLLNWTPRK